MASAQTSRYGAALTSSEVRSSVYLAVQPSVQSLHDLCSWGMVYLRCSGSFGYLGGPERVQSLLLTPVLPKWFLCP